MKLRKLLRTFFRLFWEAIDAAIEDQRNGQMWLDVFRNARKGSGCFWRDSYECITKAPATADVYGCPLMRGDAAEFFERVNA